MEYDEPFRVEYVPKSGDYWFIACDNCGLFTQVPSHAHTMTWRKNHKCDPKKTGHDHWRPQ